MTGYITLLWNDTRVKVTGERESDGTVILDKSCLNAVWTPDIWIERLVEFTQQKVTGSKFAYRGVANSYKRLIKQVSANAAISWTFSQICRTVIVGYFNFNVKYFILGFGTFAVICRKR